MQKLSIELLQQLKKEDLSGYYVINDSEAREFLLAEEFRNDFLNNDGVKV